MVNELHNSGSFNEKFGIIFLTTENCSYQSDCTFEMTELFFAVFPLQVFFFLYYKKCFHPSRATFVPILNLKSKNIGSIFFSLYPIVNLLQLQNNRNFLHTFKFQVMFTLQAQHPNEELQMGNKLIVLQYCPIK